MAASQSMAAIGVPLPVRYSMNLFQAVALGGVDAEEGAPDAGLTEMILSWECKPSTMPGVTHGYGRIFASRDGRACRRVSVHAVTGMSERRKWGGAFRLARAIIAR